jgi:hypothetical protein
MFDPNQGTANSSLLGRCAMKSLLRIVVAFTPASARAVDAPAEPYPWMSHMMWGAGWYGMIFMPLFMILMLTM